MNRHEDHTLTDAIEMSGLTLNRGAILVLRRALDSEGQPRRNAGVHWLVRLSCGHEEVRWGVALRRNHRLGKTPRCFRCGRKAAGGT